MAGFNINKLTKELSEKIKNFNFAQVVTALNPKKYPDYARSLKFSNIKSKYDALTPKKQIIVNYLGFSFLGSAVFFFFLLLTFPSDKIAELALLIAEQQSGKGLVAAEYDGWSMTGAEYTELKVYSDHAKQGDPLIVFDELKSKVVLGPLIFGSLKVVGEGELFGGPFSYAFATREEQIGLHFEIEDLDVSRFTYFKDNYGAGLVGSLNAELDYSAGELGKHKGDGKMLLNVKDFGFEGLDLGIIKIEPFDSHKIRGEFNISKGVIDPKVFKLEGSSLVARGEGAITLGDRPERTRVNLTLNMKPDDSRGDLGMIFQQAGLKKSRKDEYVYKFSRTLGQIF